MGRRRRGGTHDEIRVSKFYGRRVVNFQCAGRSSEVLSYSRMQSKKKYSGVDVKASPPCPADQNRVNLDAHCIEMGIRMRFLKAFVQVEQVPRGTCIHPVGAAPAQPSLSSPYIPYATVPTLHTLTILAPARDNMPFLRKSRRTLSNGYAKARVMKVCCACAKAGQASYIELSPGSVCKTCNHKPSEAGCCPDQFVEDVAYQNV